jgi:hypothetical protein
MMTVGELIEALGQVSDKGKSVMLHDADGYVQPVHEVIEDADGIDLRVQGSPAGPADGSITHWPK